MLQQTQAARVEPIFEAFLVRFPEVGALAGAPRADVIRAWDGLGYNRRAVALHAAAGVIVRDHGGRMPRDLELLRGLPGVGPYTAAAVASIGFGEPVPALDTNVRRVVARVILGGDAADVPRRSLEAAASSWLDRSAPGDWNQAVMDLGRLLCRPPSPVRRQAAFEGSDRQVRGAIVRALRAGRSLDLPRLSAKTGHDSARIGGLIEALVRDGLVERTGSGRVRLPAR
jgi:A/G-specific adenine glycosylase